MGFGVDKDNQFYWLTCDRRVTYFIHSVTRNWSWLNLQVSHENIQTACKIISKPLHFGNTGQWHILEI